MKTLILCGSPRKNGNTKQLIDYLCSNLDHKVEVLWSYDMKFSPCIDCRFCNKKAGCVFSDDFTLFLEKLENCDNFVVATPLYFGSITGQLMSFFSRLQTYYANNFLRLGNQKIQIKPKKTALLIASGMGYPNIEYLACGQFNYISNEVNGKHIGTAHLKKTDNLTEDNLKKAYDEILYITRQFNQK